MNADKDGLDSLTERVLGAVFEVINTLGGGFLEKVYQRALLKELALRGIRAVAEASFQSPIRVILSEITLPICSSKTCWWSS
jgi:GxxExxY protein